MKQLDTLALVLTGVGGLNWGLVGLLRVDLVAAVGGGMAFGQTNLASRVVYTLVGAAAAYLLARTPTLTGTRDHLPSAT